MENGLMFPVPLAHQSSVPVFSPTDILTNAVWVSRMKEGWEMEKDLMFPVHQRITLIWFSVSFVCFLHHGLHTKDEI